MKQFNTLLKFEILLQNRSYHMIRNSAYMMLLASVIFSIMLPHDFLNDHVKMLMCVFGVVFAALSLPHYLVKIDMQDGILETLLSHMKPWQIFCAKYAAIIFNMGVGVLISLPITIIFFALSLPQALFLLWIITLILLQVVALILLANIIHAYFRHSTNFLIAIMLPLMLPGLIIAGMGLETFKMDFAMMLLGIDMIIVPTSAVLSSYLLANLYEI